MAAPCSSSSSSLPSFIYFSVGHRSVGWMAPPTPLSAASSAISQPDKNWTKGARFIYRSGGPVEAVCVCVSEYWFCRVRTTSKTLVPCLSVNWHFTASKRANGNFSGNFFKNLNSEFCLSNSFIRWLKLHSLWLTIQIKKFNFKLIEVI